MTYTLLAIGPANPVSDHAWLNSPYIDRVVRQPSSAISGKRLGSRVLGIGLDSFLLAVRTLQPGIRGPYLANNPWIGAALRVTGRKDFVVTGIYAEPTSRSWKVLRKLIGGAPVITLSESEVAPWNAAGGRAEAVLYGNTFGYPSKRAPQGLHIFVGGTSDRDLGAIRSLEEEVLRSEIPVRLTLATGEPPQERVSGGNVVSRPGPLSPRDFGALLSTASVVFLPLLEGTRAAGHMVLVGAVESGIPVAATSSQGMSEYLIGPAVSSCDRNRPFLPQLRAIAEAAEGEENSIQSFWHETFSLSSYIGRVGDILKRAES
ncbi:hypothetical protein J2805_000784 [Arthrobacter oryzae]|nr:hypothetical protein [Arthrobacter oryzae]